MVARIEPTEQQIHVAVVDLLNAYARPGLIYFHVPNGEHRHISVAKKLKKMGVLPGVADFVLIRLMGKAAFLEIKEPNEGRQSKAQKEFEAQCHLNGSPYYVAHSFEEARDWLSDMDMLQPIPQPHQRSGDAAGRGGSANAPDPSKQSGEFVS